MTDVDDAGDNRTDVSNGVVGALPHRLGVATEYGFDVRGFADKIPHMQDAMKVSAKWQVVSSIASFREAAAVDSGVEIGRVYELLRYQAAAGETLAMACASGIEAALWSRDQTQNPKDTTNGEAARAEMAHRAVAELQSHFLISVGHDLVNIIARALALDAGLRPHLLDIVGSGFPVGGDDRDNYLSINQPTAKELRKVARRSDSKPFKDVVDPVTDLAISTPWQQMMAHRGKDFHRVRAQSHGVTGLSAVGPWTIGDNYRSIDIGLPPLYVETQGLAERLTRVNRDALGELATAMRLTFDALNLVFNEVGA